MKTTRRRKREKEQMRGRILDAALHLFSRGGLDSVTMRAVADRIEYSPAAIYRYFNGKEDILQKLCVRGFDIFYSRLRLAAEGHDNPMDKLSSMSRAYLDFALSHPDYYQLMFTTPQTPAIDDPEGELSPRKSFWLLVEVVSKCIEAGCFPEADPVSRAVSIWGTVHGLASLTIGERLRAIPEDERDDVVAQALDFALRTESCRD